MSQTDRIAVTMDVLMPYGRTAIVDGTKEEAVEDARRREAATSDPEAEENEFDEGPVRNPRDASIH